MVEALGAFVLERTAESVVLAARRTLVGRLLRLRLTDWERLPPGDLMSRVTSDTTLLRAVSTQAVVSAATARSRSWRRSCCWRSWTSFLLGVTLGVVALIGGAVALVMPRIAQATERRRRRSGRSPSRWSGSSGGTHEELVAQDQLYAQLAATQLLAPTG